MNLPLCFRENALHIARSDLHPAASPGNRRSRSAFTLVFALGVLFASTAQLEAREKKDLAIDLATQRVTRDAAGAEVYSEDVSVNPGDVVRYIASYHNNSATPLQRLAPTLPIPKGLQYIAGSALPVPTSASLDGKKFEPLPIRRAHQLADGREILVEVPATSYRALRWDAGELAPGASFVATARARVAAGAIAAP